MQRSLWVEGLLPEATLMQKGLLPKSLLSPLMSINTANNNLILLAKNSGTTIMYLSAFLSVYFSGYNFLYSIVGSNKGFFIKKISSSGGSEPNINFYTDNNGNLYVKPDLENASSKFRMMILDYSNFSNEESFVISDENVQNLQLISIEN